MAQITELLNQYPTAATVFGLIALAIGAFVADGIVKRVFLTVINRVARKTSTKFDDVLLELNVFGRLAHSAPAVAVYFGIQMIPGVPQFLDDSVRNAAMGALVLVAVSAIAAFLTAVEKNYARSSIAEGRPIEAYVQVTKIAVYVVGGVMFVAVLTGREPMVMLGGLGALMAVLLLVFRDTILSFVASLQMASYDMVRVGDWIEMQQYGADGDVIELSLHTVKIQNWDKTITSIPTHKLIDQSFKNWRGMQDSGGRRIKRSFFVDMASIRFLTEQELDRLENFAVLRDYISQKRAELSESNEEFAHDSDLVANARRLTNVGTLRAYLVAYLRQHSKIHQDMTLIVRQLAPTSEGLPIELYVFTNITGWVAYEDIQSDIFDHIFSIVSEFGLRVFQAPSGGDFARLGPPGNG
jgi:miniconductance mechanosensitive channel